MSGSGFTVDVDLNGFLAEGASQVDAIVTVTGAGVGATPATEGLEIIIIDCSSSMSGGKIRAARQATKVAINELRDGVAFTVIVGTEVARQLYPYRGTSVVASARTRAEAKGAVDKLPANGGTAIGAWLRLATTIAEQHPGALRHAILLTDGQNGETEARFRRALDDCLGKFTCDCRGVGTDWVVDELRTIASALLGSVDIVADPADLAADFRAVMGAAMDKRVADVALRLWTPRGATVRIVKQVEPTVEDLTGRRVESGNLRGDYPLGAWGSETRAYHLQIDVPPGAVGDEILAGRVSLVPAGSDGNDGAVLGKGLIPVTWTDDTAAATQISRAVAHYTGQVELAEAIQEGLAARRAGDIDTATARLGRARELATESGHDATAQLLGGVIDVDERTGTVRLRATVTDVDEMTLETRSVRTVRVRGEDD